MTVNILCTIYTLQLDRVRGVQGLHRLEVRGLQVAEDGQRRERVSRTGAARVRVPAVDALLRDLREAATFRRRRKRDVENDHLYGRNRFESKLVLILGPMLTGLVTICVKIVSILTQSIQGWGVY